MEDYLIAQNIIKTGNMDHTIYNKYSFIYKTTNEDINGYSKYLENREDVLSVIGSGDQILNSILFDSKNIDIFDISTFPKYYLDLKLASLERLNKENYLNFFYGNYRDEEYMDDIYFSFNRYLSKESKLFWDYLFNYFEYIDVFNSPLFSSEAYTYDSLITRNTYLQDDNFEKLKEKFRNVNINYYNTDIRDFDAKKYYDFINLSSIIYYVSNYRELVLNLPLKEKGVILTYLYAYLEDKDNYYDGFSFERINNEDNRVMVYKK